MNAPLDSPPHDPDTSPDPNEPEPDETELEPELTEGAVDEAPASGAVHTAARDKNPIRWAWVGGGVVIGAFLVSLFIYLVDPGLERLDLSGFVFALSLILVGIFVGYRSPGVTIREAALAGVILLLLVAIVAIGFLRVDVPIITWLMSPFLAAIVTMAGGWVGEMLQGTLEEAHEDRAVDWPWVFVSVVVGLMLSAYAVFIGQALFDITNEQSLYLFALSFLVTGWIVGFLSPGVTMVEPAIAAGMLVLADGTLVVMWFEDIPGSQLLLIGFGGGMVLGLLGGWLGELTQQLRKRRSATGR
jgi:hypothetical protein